MGPSSSRRWRLRLLLLLLLLQPVASTQAVPECQVQTEGGTKECTCEIDTALTLKISTAADPGTDFKWKDPKDNVIADGNDYELPTEQKSVKIKSVKDADAGTYKVEYKLSNVGKEEKFTVQPLVVCETPSCNVNVGQNVRLKSGAATATWTFKDNSGLSPRATPSGGNLDIINVNAADHNGVYKAATSPEKSFTLTVGSTERADPTVSQGDDPTATNKPGGGRRVVVKAGSSKAITGKRFTLDCAVTGSSATATAATGSSATATAATIYEWQKDGQVMVGQKGASVVFEALQKTDEGTYVCKVGDDRSDGYSLTVTASGGAVAASYSPALLMTLSLLHVLLRLVCD